jgi:hypothetical protein
MGEEGMCQRNGLIYRKKIFIFFAGIRKWNQRGKIMIQGTLSISAFPSIGYAISASKEGKMSLPVSQSNLLYSHFKHVSGVAANDGQRGVAITKLKVLDVLIEQLVQLKRTEGSALTPGNNFSDEHIDALIVQYENQIRTARAAAIAMPYNTVPMVPAGALVNLMA